MKAISLWQPWASLVAVGLKRFETRGWETSYRGPLAMHAAKRTSRLQRELFDEFGLSEVFGCPFNELPFGCVVATTVLAEVFTTEQIKADGLAVTERIYGDYEDGRFAWKLDDIERIEPVPAVGRQRFFDVELEAVE